MNTDDMTTSLDNDLRALSAALDPAGPWRVPEIRPCRVTVQSSAMARADDVVSHLRSQLEQAAGWIETTECAVPWRHGDPWPPGVLLNAELADGTRSMQVREMNGAWTVTRIEEHARDDAVQGALPVWAVRRVQLNVDPDGPPWHHRLYLREDGDRLRGFASRLLGCGQPSSAEEKQARGEGQWTNG